MSTSKLQRRVSEALSVHFGYAHIKENVRPDWLLGDMGERLELDFWIVDLNVAIEVQGEQHYRYVRRFHPTPNSFSQQLRRDRIKRSRCEDRGIMLYEIASDFDLWETVERINDLRTPAKSILDDDAWQSAIDKKDLLTTDVHDANVQLVGVGVKYHIQRTVKVISGNQLRSLRKANNRKDQVEVAKIAAAINRKLARLGFPEKPVDKLLKMANDRLLANQERAGG